MRRVDLSSIELASSETARNINRDIVLEMIRSHQPVSRAELARLSGLQRSTISLIIEQLIGEKWVREGAIARQPRGRRPTLLGLNEDLVVIAADVHPAQSSVAVVDLNGRLLSRSVISLGADPAAAVELLSDCILRLKANFPRKSVEGIGISLPGRVDPANERLIFAPNLRWPDFDIKKAIEGKTGLPVALENAANACLVAELWFGRMEGVRNAVLVTISEGVGTGVFANGHLVTGQYGMAGEFGHAVLDPDGPACGCGRKGCWETFASCRAALRYYSDLAHPEKAVTFQQLLSLAETGDPHAAEALRRQAEAIGRGMQLIVVGLSPEVILVAGDVTTAWHRYGAVIEEHISRLTLAGSPPRLTPTHEGEVARLRGAAALVLQRRSSQEGASDPARVEVARPSRRSRAGQRRQRARKLAQELA
ncbi:MAG: ROK family protein [Acidobacteriaceae bacterium]|nr:ROK family protein [Acidobacteriaceae bacterium]